ncbi:MAG: DNA repair protein RecN [Bacteroidales bacterium]|nr:DNA repair protein RecN [Bacteroidales bacterium]
MLQSILIDNYALIDHLEIEFNQGFTIITGETGAGKSIILGALGLLLGKRADTGVLKDESRKCIVEGSFLVDGYGLETFFKEQELDFSSQIIIRREISPVGKSRAFINDTPVNLNMLQVLTLSLVDLHSQHQNLSLNNESYIRWIIDSYAGLSGTVNGYGNLYKEYLEEKKQYTKASEAYKNDQDNLDFITHQFNELQAAQLKGNELSSLETEYNILIHAEEIKSALEGVSQILSSEDIGVVEKLKSVAGLLGKISPNFSSAEDLEKRLQSSYIELKDIASEVELSFEKVEYDPGKMEGISQRIDLLYNLLRKYKAENEEELINLRDNLDSKLQNFAIGDYELAKLQEALKKKEEKITALAREISLKRKACFDEFITRVIALLKSMGMKHAVFQIKADNTPLSETGIDNIQFLFSANINIGVKDIASVASGGELSRLMLSIKYLISNASGLPTIIFDEIDSGVSGEIAHKVGLLIKEMSENMQVISITHLPQVASLGEHHFQVYKENVNGSTLTDIKKLDNEQRLTEIAKMLSGEKLTDEAIENARILLKQ